MKERGIPCINLCKILIVYTGNGVLLYSALHVQLYTSVTNIDDQRVYVSQLYYTGVYILLYCAGS